jgi:hypothetical protein
MSGNLSRALTFFLCKTWDCLKGGDPYGNGVFIVSKVAVVMTAAQADFNMCRWIVCTTERVTTWEIRRRKIGGYDIKDLEVCGMQKVISERVFVMIISNIRS